MSRKNREGERMERKKRATDNVRFSFAKMLFCDTRFRSTPTFVLGWFSVFGDAGIKGLETPELGKGVSGLEMEVGEKGEEDDEEDEEEEEETEGEEGAEETSTGFKCILKVIFRRVAYPLVLGPEFELGTEFGFETGIGTGTGLGGWVGR